MTAFVEEWMRNDARGSETAVARFVMMILLNGIKSGAEKIHFERTLEPDSATASARVSYEKDGAIKEENDIWPERWEEIVGRLKVMAKMIDYGPNKSTDGKIHVRLSKNRTVEFRMTTNPNPFRDTKVTLESLDL